MDQEKVNLFIYGSLRDRAIFRSVCGLSFTAKATKKRSGTLFAELALLDGHRKVSPDNVYFYAVADAPSRIEGYLIHNVPASAVAQIDRYEGGRYYRETVKVNTADGLCEAEAYLASQEKMKKHFGDRFHVNLIHELWLRKRIDEFIKNHTRPGERTTDAKIERRAHRELLGITERDLVISHYRTDAVSDFYLEHELDRPRPGISYVCAEPEAQPFLSNYLIFVVRQVLLNQFDAKIQSRYRFDLEHMQASERYFKRTLSLLMALRMLNASSSDVRLICERALEAMPPGKYDLIDYVKYAVTAADSIFFWRMAQAQLRWIRANLQGGLVPLGTEIELSNLGFKAIMPSNAQSNAHLSDLPDSYIDPAYNGFKYFCDFHLDIFTWKLGGYIDDHSGSTSLARRQGFLELAPGRLNIEGELSRPATADPWVLSNLIREIVAFYDVAPHSLHLSFQLRKKQIGTQKLLPLGFVKCLFVLGGGLQQKSAGRLWVSRMGHDEITQDKRGIELVFARTSKRKWYLGADYIADKTPSHAAAFVQQYKFIRLDPRANYEPLILCLKGLQLNYNPADYLTAEQLRSSSRLRAEFKQLREWAAEPTPISPNTIAKFLSTIRTGLMNEWLHRPAHKLHYIDWALSAVDVQLRMFNKQLRKILT